MKIIYLLISHNYIVHSIFVSLQCKRVVYVLCGELSDSDHVKSTHDKFHQEQIELEANCVVRIGGFYKTRDERCQEL
jgi:hypothetical protein